MKKTIQLNESELINIINKVLNEQTKSTTTTSPVKGKDCGNNQFPCGGGCCNNGGAGYRTTCVDGMCRDYSVSNPTK